jgi:hypothetical protein
MSLQIDFLSFFKVGFVSAKMHEPGNGRSAFAWDRKQPIGMIGGWTHGLM